MNSSSIRFEIEAITAIAKGGFRLFARVLTSHGFALTPTSTMLGTTIAHLAQPRALYPDGRPRFDLYVFDVRRSDVQIGDVVELESVRLLE